jgi:D-glycero-D-manno-heptose 1,7-bisphosphate phosphatase
MKKNMAVFLDRDGTINEEVGYIDSLDKLKISNQAGVARGLFTEEFVRTTNNYVQNILGQQGAYINNFYYCPHHPTEGEEPYRQACDCRKPAPGMLIKAAQDLNIDLKVSYLVGDRFLDIEAARKAGVKGILVKTGYGRTLLQDDGPDKATPENKPDFIASDILEAVKWILKARK